MTTQVKVVTFVKIVKLEFSCP